MQLISEPRPGRNHWEPFGYHFRYHQDAGLERPAGHSIYTMTPFQCWLCTLIGQPTT